MKKVEPYLFRYKKECVSPRRAVDVGDYKYDDSLDLMLFFENGCWIPIIEIKKPPKRRTKKADIEKGEDQKDSLMWR
ncbi:MAG: hypothetical protein ACFFDN_48045 [Candidatus Hodarchaeota archaeon]